MGLFGRKKSVRLDVFCREFYDTHILTPVIAGVDAGRTCFETAKRSVTEVDGTFAAVDGVRFFSEMTLIHFEVFCLAWLHQLGDKYAAAQSAFTESYLKERGRADIWGALEAYNQAIARSSTLGQTSETPAGRAYLTFTNKMRADLFDQWHKQGFEPEAVARATNRISTDVAWDKGVTADFLILVLCGRLGCEVNEEAKFRLIAVIRGLYDGVRESLKPIKVEA